MPTIEQSEILNKLLGLFEYLPTREKVIVVRNIIEGQSDGEKREIVKALRSVLPSGITDSLLGTLLPAVFGIVGVLAGAYMTGTTTEKISREAVLATQRTTAYAQLLEANAKPIATLNKAEKLKQESDRTAAKFKIFIYASKPVMEAMERIEQTMPHSEDRKKAVLKWYQAMRTEVAGEGAQVRDETISTIIWPHEYQPKPDNPVQK